MRCYTNGKPEQELIYGWRPIAGYLGVSEVTARKWRDEHGLPVAKMPNGQLGTTKSLIDQWLLSRCDYQTKNGTKSVANLQHAA